MAKYIDADKLIAGGWRLERHAPNGRCLTIMSIADVPTADVEEVVRCKDCKYLKYGYQCYCPLGMNLSNNEDAYVLVNANKDFCSYGTPKERGGEK